MNVCNIDGCERRASYLVVSYGAKYCFWHFVRLQMETK